MGIFRKDPYDQFMSGYKEQAKQMIRLNESLSDQYIDDPMYGAIPTMPVYTNMVDGSKEYLAFVNKNLKMPLTWKREGNLSVDGINGLIDIYKGYLFDDLSVITLYINMYCSHNSTTIPKVLLYLDGQGAPEDNKTIEYIFKNASAAERFVEDPEYGLVPNKPAYVHLIEGSKEYLSSFRTDTAKREKLRWKFRKTENVEGIYGEVSVYDCFLPSGELYKTVYVNKYCAYNSTTIPEGFI